MKVLKIKERTEITRVAYKNDVFMVVDNNNYRSIIAKKSIPKDTLLILEEGMEFILPRISNLNNMSPSKYSNFETQIEVIIGSPKLLFELYPRDNENDILLSVKNKLDDNCFFVHKEGGVSSSFISSVCSSFNHNCNCNCGYRITCKKEFSFISIYTIKDINKGEELLIDYGENIHSPNSKFKCNCGLDETQRRELRIHNLYKFYDYDNQFNFGLDKKKINKDFIETCKLKNIDTTLENKIIENYITKNLMPLNKVHKYYLDMLNSSFKMSK